MSGVAEPVVKRGPGRPKKSEAKVAAEDAVQNHANAVVEAYAEAKDAENVPVRESVVPAPVLRPCSLESAPVGSKIVVGASDEGKVVNLTTPSEVIQLPKNDLAYSLPRGAKIRRVMPDVFVATMLNPQENIRDLTCGSARDAVEQFRVHFKMTD